MLLLLAALALATEPVLVQNRSAFFFDEPIEVALTGVEPGSAKLTFRPEAKGASSLVLTIPVREREPLITLPGGTLAPGAYTLILNEKSGPKFTISHGVNPSRMRLSQTVGEPKKAGGNFLVGNAFGFGLLDPRGLPAREVRGKRSSGLEVFEKAIRDEMPSLVYMYWTGYVTHKPFGSEKSWAADDMREATRLLSFHTAQRIRRYARNIELVGTLDEPGLSWGKTPAGGMASGFPNWDEQGYYIRRGWKYTDNPAARDAADWMSYMTARCDILREVTEQGKRDLKRVWPEVVFSTDLYAPHATMDGTDPLNQRVNDVPSSHVFVDWGVGKLGALSGLYLEKSHDPTSRIAHAMNGQLFSAPVPQPQQRQAYRLMLNAMLAAGLHSNWWLNTTGMTSDDLAWVNEAGLRYGSLFREFAPDRHDVAVLWSFTEAAMRQKDVAAREAKKKTGEQIKLMIASLPDVPGAKDKLIDINAYNVGGNYKEQILTAHQALTRAGYPSHILHERVLAEKLAAYKTLVIVGQTFDLPADVQSVIDSWQRKGGTIIVDRTSTVRFKDAIMTDADFKDPAFRWGAYFGAAEKKPHPFKSDREASVYHTNWFMDEMVRKAVPAMRTVMKRTKSQPAIVTDSIHLAAERHTVGEQQMILVINAHDQLPEIPETRRHHLYNYAPLEARYSLAGLDPKAVVWCIEGSEWKKVSKVKEPTKVMVGQFEPGEMKMYLVLPPGSTECVQYLTALRKGNSIEVSAGALNDKDEGAVLPLTVTLNDPNGKELYKVHRATESKGIYRERFPIGRNAQLGTYSVTLESPIGDKTQTVRATIATIDPAVEYRVQSEPAIAFDTPAMRDFLKRSKDVVVAYPLEYKSQAESLAKALGAKARPESEVLRKVPYPRVWNPFATVYSVGGAETRPSGAIKARITVTTGPDGSLVATSDEGKDVSNEWNLPQSVITFAGVGWVDMSGDREECFGPGVKVYLDENRRRTVLNATKAEAKTDVAFRAKWARSWTRLTSHVGAYQLPPQLPEAYRAETSLILLGNSTTSEAVAIVQASEILPRVVDAKYPAKGRALLQYAWSPFAVEKDAIVIGANDADGIEAGIKALLEMR